MTRPLPVRKSWTWVTIQTLWLSSVVPKSPKTSRLRFTMNLISQLENKKVSNQLLSSWPKLIRNTLTFKTPLLLIYSMTRKKAKKPHSELPSVFKRLNHQMLENGLRVMTRKPKKLHHWKAQRVETPFGKSNYWSKTLQLNWIITLTESFFTPTKVLEKTSSTVLNHQTFTQMMLTERN